MTYKQKMQIAMLRAQNNPYAKCRNKVGVSQRNLAEISGVDFKSLQRYEKSQKHKPTLDAQFLLSIALDYNFVNPDHATEQVFHDWVYAHIRSLVDRIRKMRAGKSRETALNMLRANGVTC